MRLNITSTFQYILYFGMAMFLSVPKMPAAEVCVKEVKQQPAAMENTEIIHSEILFNF